jgi:hypothetical protein
MLDFRTVWPDIYRELSIGTKIPNWSVEGYTGKDTRIEDTNYDEIVVSTPGIKRTRRVPRRDFEKVFEFWESYKAGDKTRMEILKLTQNSTYILSILHWYDGTSGVTPQTT